MRVYFKVASSSNLHQLTTGFQNGFALMLLGHVLEFIAAMKAIMPQIGTPQSANWCMQSA